MRAAYILLTVGCIFLAAGALRLTQQGRTSIQARTWVLVAIVFIAVGLWLAYSSNS